MESLLEYFSSLGPDSIYYYYIGLLTITCIGLIPNNVELTILVGGILAGIGKIPILQLSISIYIIVLVVENSLFIFGRHFGYLFFKIPFYKKILPIKRRELIKSGIEKYPLHTFASLRITPILRPVFFIGVGSMNTSPRVFFKYHAFVTFIYYSLLVFLAYQFTHLIQYYFYMYTVQILIFFVVLWVIISKSLSKKFISL
jgi:membrane protein DedA with SNARE-associated domain